MKNLNSKGIAHYMALLAFVVIFAIGGVAYLVATSAYSEIKAKCSFQGVPEQPLNGQAISPAVVITNTGSSTFAFTLKGELNIYGDAQHQEKAGPTITTPRIAPGQSVTIDSGLRYTAGWSSNISRSVIFDERGYISQNSSQSMFECTAYSKMPTYSSSSTSTPQTTANGTYPVSRFAYNGTGNHRLKATSSLAGASNEGVLFYAYINNPNVQGVKNVYEFRNTSTAEYCYSLDQADSKFPASTWANKAVAFSAYPTNSTPGLKRVWRLTKGDHCIMSASETEANSLVSSGWTNDGVLFYAPKS